MPRQYGFGIVGAGMIAAYHADAIKQLRSELRRNGVLLAQARSCLQHAVDLLHPRKGNTRQGTLRTSM